jgi:phosphoserine aminotransferase
MQGGAIGENAIVPMNLIAQGGSADYVHTATGRRSRQGSQDLRHVNIAAAASASSRDPPQSEWKLDPRLRVTSAPTRPSAACSTTGRPTPAACRWWPTCPRTSCRAAIDVCKYGLIYAGAQKNMGPSGVTLVIVRDDLLGHALPITPSAFNYQLQAENDSMYNTPPTYAIYIAGLVFKHVKAQGGWRRWSAQPRQGAGAVRLPRRSSFYRNPVRRRTAR